MIRAVKETEISFICVGTPSRDDGSIDLCYIESVSAQIGLAIKEKQEYHCVLVKSTVVPGTCDQMVIPLITRNSGKSQGINFGAGSNPEFLKKAGQCTISTIPIESSSDPTIPGYCRRCVNCTGNSTARTSNARRGPLR